MNADLIAACKALFATKLESAEPVVGRGAIEMRLSPEAQKEWEEECRAVWECYRRGPI